MDKPVGDGKNFDNEENIENPSEMSITQKINLREGNNSPDDKPESGSVAMAQYISDVKRNYFANRFSSGRE